MEATKAEVEDKVKEILKLIKSKDNGITKDSKKESKLADLIKDIHHHYQSLFALNNRLRGESGRRCRGRKEKGRYISSCSSSESEYYSSEDIEINNRELRDAHQRVANSSKQGLKDKNPKVVDLKHKLMSTTKEKEDLNSEYLEALSKIQIAEAINKNLRDEADERQREISALVKEHDVCGSRASALIKELEGQLSSLRLELESMRDQKRDLEMQFANKATEAKKLGEKNTELHSQVSELELISKEKGDEVANLLKKLKDNKSNLTSKIEDLTDHSSHLQQEADSLGAPKDTVTNQVRGLTAQVDVMQRDLVLLTSQKNELESLLKGKKKEVSESLTLVKNLKKELTEKAAIEQRMLKENGGLLVQVNDLKLEMESLGNQKKELEEQIDSKTNDTKQLREENERLCGRISEMENEISVLKRKYNDLENEASIGNMQVKKSQIEKQETSQRVSELEEETAKLANKINDQQKIMKEQEDTIKMLTEEFKMAKHQILGSKASLQIAEGKMSELAEDFRKKLEDNIRVLYRRIQVAEQLHNENKDSYRKTKEELKEANRLLQDKGLGTPRARSRKMGDMLETGNKVVAGLDSLVREFEAKGDLPNRISKVSNEIAFAKNWVKESKSYKKKLQQQVETLAEQLDDKMEQECLLKERVSNLEAKLGKQGGDKLNMIQTVNELERKVGDLENQIKEKDELEKKVRDLENKIKEQDEGLLSLGEEKREAIRQLCVVIDHQRTHCDHLKGMIAKTTTTKRRS